MHSLSFLTDGRWVPDRSGDYEGDCKRGRAYAEEMLDLIERTGNPAVFGGIVRAITDAGQFDGIEAGFCARIGMVIYVNVSSGS